jgi:hypothetical protein
MEASVPRLLGSVLIVAALGCKSANEPGEEKYAALAGTLSKVLEAPFPDAYAATMTGMRELRLSPMEWERDGFRAMIVGETVMGQISQSTEVRVWLTRATDATTKIELRIVGRRDEERLKQILAEIESRLPKKPAPAAAPGAPPAPDPKAPAKE